jgi:Domain of unknown function (DUF4397)
MTRSRLRKALTLLGVILLGSATALAGASAAFGAADLGAKAAPTTGQLYIIHGIADAKVDVFLDGKNVCPGAIPKTIVGPINVAAGQHVVSIKQHDGTLITEGQFPVTAGSSIDLVAHRKADASKTPQITKFDNDLSPVGPSKGRLTVAHVAVVPPADIRLDGTALFRNVGNDESLTQTVPAKSYTLDVVPAATTGPAILKAETLKIKAGVLTRVFLIGDPSTTGVMAVPQSLSLPGSASGPPRLVPTGDGGQLATEFVDPRAPLGRFSLISLALGLTALIASRRIDPAARAVRRRHAR